MNDIEKLLQIMAKLRDPKSGCPWDVQQSFSTIAPYTIEEAYEVADAIARNDLDDLKSELGDLLFQVVFHARMAEEQDAFDFNAVVQTIIDKMVRRHPHVFGSPEQIAAGPEQGSWERIKTEERGATHGERGVLDDVALGLPALKRAEKLGKRAAGAGFDWPDTSGVRDKIREELDELSAAEVGGREDDIREEFGDVLFSLVNLARHLRIDPEDALSAANHKFSKRFRRVEKAVTAASLDMSEMDIEELEALWQRAKQ